MPSTWLLGSVLFRSASWIGPIGSTSSDRPSSARRPRHGYFEWPFSASPRWDRPTPLGSHGSAHLDRPIWIGLLDWFLSLFPFRSALWTKPTTEPTMKPAPQSIPELTTADVRAPRGSQIGSHRSAPTPAPWIGPSERPPWFCSLGSIHPARPRRIDHFGSASLESLPSRIEAPRLDASD